jgi:glycosyltransferase involved in cell wall biosynthesis
LHILPSLAQGGAEKFTLDLCSELAEDSSVELLTFYAGGKFDALFNDKFKIIKNDFSSFRRVFLPFYLYFKFITGKYNIVHMHLMTIFFCFPIIFFVRNVKYIYTFHGDPCYDYWLVRKSIFILSKFNLVRFVAVSSDVLNLVTTEYPGINVSLIENGAVSPIVNEKVVDKLRCEYEGKMVFVNVARAHKIKNQIELVKAFSELPAHVHLLIVGSVDEGDYSIELMRLIEETGNVTHLGFRKDVGNILTIADFSIISSHHEGLPMSLIESLSLGVPVLTTPIFNLKAMVLNNSIGYVFNGYIAGDFKRKILELVMPNFNSSMKSNARKLYFDFYDISICKEKYELVYND